MSKKDYNMVQCKLINNNIHLTSWIPVKYAKLNKVVSLKNTGKYTVGVIYNNIILPRSVVIERSNDYKRTRKASDV